MNKPTFVPTVIRTKASASLDEEVKKELNSLPDTKEYSIAELRKDKDGNSNSDKREGKA